MTLREKAVARLKSETSSDVALLDEFDNNDELFYVGVDGSSCSGDELCMLMESILEDADDVMQNVTVASDVDLEEMNVSDSKYDTVLRVSHTLS